MATKVFHIELEVTNVDTDERLDAITKAMQRAGRLLISDALLICGNEPAPTIRLYGESLIEGRHKVNLGDE